MMWVPVHPVLAAVLGVWHSVGWARFMGREPGRDDLVVPGQRGGVRSASKSGDTFKEGARRLGLSAQTHCESRSTFRSLAQAGGPIWGRST